MSSSIAFVKFAMPAFVPGSVALRLNRRARSYSWYCECSPPPPADLPSAVRIAGESLRRACLPQRAQTHFLIPGLNTTLEDTFPYSDSLLSDAALLLGETAAKTYADEDGSLPNVVLLFKSAGTAAAARAYYSKSNRFPELLSSGRLYIKSFALRDSPFGGNALLPEHNSVAIVVNPATSRGDKVVDEVKALTEREVGRAFILLNPDFSADVSALGIVERGRRDDFLASFTPVFYLRTLAYIKRPTLVATEQGALLRAFPSDFSVWRLTSAGSFEATKSFRELPSRAQITDALEIAPQLNAEECSEGIPEAESALLRTLVVLSVLASGTFYVLRVHAPHFLLI